MNKFLNVLVFLVLSLCTATSGFSQGLETFLQMESSDVYRLLHEEVLDLNARELRQAMSRLGSIKYTDLHQLESAVSEETAADGSERLSNRKQLNSGTLLSVDAVYPQFGTANTKTISTPEEAVEAAMAFDEDQTVFYACVIKQNESGSVAEKDEAENSLMLVLTATIPQWIERRVTPEAAHLDLASDLESNSIHVQCVSLHLDARTVRPSLDFAQFEKVVVCKRLAWQPASVAEVQAARLGLESDVHQDWVDLSLAGFDVSLLDNLQSTQRMPLQAKDNEPFYQLLKIGSMLNRPQLLPRLPIRDSIVNPQDLVGRQFQFSLVVKQITRVPLAIEDRGSQLGIEDYFLLHGLVPIEKPIRLKISDTESLTYQSQYPVVIATRSLPAGWEPGENMRRWAEARAVFFKSWSYESARTLETATDQWSPLMVATNLTPIHAPEHSGADWPIGWLLLIPISLAMLGLLIAGISGFRR